MSVFLRSHFPPQLAGSLGKHRQWLAPISLSDAFLSNSYTPAFTESLTMPLATGRLCQQDNKSLLTALASCWAQPMPSLKAERKRRKYLGSACTMSIRGLRGFNFFVIVIVTFYKPVYVSVAGLLSFGMCFFSPHLYACLVFPLLE